jgi:hypothetical protein
MRKIKSTKIILKKKKEKREKRERKKTIHRNIVTIHNVLKKKTTN